MAHGTIFKMIAVLARPDTGSIVYDTEFQEPKRLDPGSVLDPLGTSGRVDLPDIELPVQVLGDVFEQLTPMITGDSPGSSFELTTDRASLRRLGLFDARGMPAIPLQTKLVRILARRSGELVHEVEYPPGLYLHEVKPRSFGLALRNPVANIWFLSFRSRDLSSRR